jgi:hypothetical protein
MADFTNVQKHLTAITTAQMDYVKASMAANKVYFGELAQVKSPTVAMMLTAKYGQSSSEAFIVDAKKIGDMCKDFAKETFSFEPAIVETGVTTL